MPDPSDTNEFDEDPRFNFGLFDGVTGVLRAHGYRPPEESAARFRAYGNSLAVLLRLCEAYEGADPAGVPDEPGEGAVDYLVARLDEQRAELERGAER